MARFSNTIKWKCLNDISSKSTEDKISLRAAFEISPSYWLKMERRLQK